MICLFFRFLIIHCLRTWIFLNLDLLSSVFLSSFFSGGVFNTLIIVCFNMCVIFYLVNFPYYLVWFPRTWEEKKGNSVPSQLFALVVILFILGWI